MKRWVNVLKWMQSNKDSSFEMSLENEKISKCSFKISLENEEMSKCRGRDYLFF